MSYYYLVASLKTLQIGDEAPFTSEEYIDACAQWITPRQQEILRRVLLDEHHLPACDLCASWDSMETQLKNACAKLRAQTYGVDAKEYLHPHEKFNGQIEQIVTDAFTRNDPVELEQELDRGRWQLAEELIGDDPFGFGKVLAYGIQLSIVERWHKMDVSVGKEKLEAVITANTEEKTSDE